MADHLARLVYRMLRYGRQYVEKGIAEYEIKFRLFGERKTIARFGSFRLRPAPGKSLCSQSGS